MKRSEHPLKALLGYYARKYRYPIAVGIIAILLVDIAELALPILLKRVIDSFETHTTVGILRPTLIGVAAIIICQVIGRYFWRMGLAQAAMKAGANFRSFFAEQIFQVPVSLYDRRKVGDLMTLATSDVENIRMALGPGVVSVVDSFFYCVTIPIAMMWVAPNLAVKVLIPVLGIPLAVVFLQRKIADLSARVQDQIGKLGTQTQEMVAGVRLAKIYGIEGRVETRLNAHSSALNTNQVKLAKAQAAFGPTLEFFLSAGLILLFGMGMQLSIGTLVAMQRYLQKLMWPMSAVGLSVVYFQKAKASGAEFYQFLEEPKVESLYERNMAHEEPDSTQPVLEVKNLQFSYEGRAEPVIQNLSFQLNPGEWLGIEGRVASGKSTLLYLLLKFYEVERGKIFIHGKDIQDWNVQDLRSQISSVLQDPYLFHGSIRYNLDMGTSMTTESALMLAEAAGTALESRVDEKLGEKGSGLSGGQKQRIAIARALKKDSSIFLFDDPLSSVDIQTAERALKNISRELRKKKKSVIFVSHHPEHLAYCDRVIQLHSGEGS